MQLQHDLAAARPRKAEIPKKPEKKPFNITIVTLARADPFCFLEVFLSFLGKYTIGLLFLGFFSPRNIARNRAFRHQGSVGFEGRCLNQHHFVFLLSSYTYQKVSYTSNFIKMTKHYFSHFDFKNCSNISCSKWLLVQYE